MSITNQKLINPNHASIKQIKAYVPSLLYFGISHNGINEELSNIHKELMTNQEQRAKIEKLLNEIEESATGLTAEEQEALLIVKSITGIAFDLSDNLEANPKETLEKMFDDLEALDYQRAVLRSQNLPSGGIVAEVNRGGEVVINRKKISELGNKQLL